LGDVSLEDDVLLGSNVSIMNGGSQHGIDRLDIPIREQTGWWPRITIGRDSWIGDRAIVLADVGHHCVIGAGSVVTKRIPDYAIAVGSPARIIRFRNQQHVNGEPINSEILQTSDVT
jgi:acetyltransferase-like isoleucine patch superfamily enzyme